jgi:hypothetical protein
VSIVFVAGAVEIAAISRGINGEILKWWMTGAGLALGALVGIGIASIIKQPPAKE